VFDPWSLSELSKERSSAHLDMGVILRVHPVYGELHIQRNANREVTTVLI